METPIFFEAGTLGAEKIVADYQTKPGLKLSMSTQSLIPYLFLICSASALAKPHATRPDIATAETLHYMNRCYQCLKRSMIGRSDPRVKTVFKVDEPQVWILSKTR